jgi:hypothetical protein
MALVLELKRGMIFFSSNNVKEMETAIRFLQENITIVKDGHGNERTIYDVRKKYEQEIK